MSERWVTLQQGASELGVSVEAARMRVRRGSLASYKDDQGRVHVRVDSARSQTGHTDQSQAEVEGSLVEELRDRVRYLEGQVEDWKEESRRKDTIIYELVHNIPELPAGEPPTERPQSHTADAEDVFEDQPEDESETSQEPQQHAEGAFRRFWRWFITGG